jgi:hypothetical protein
MTPRAIDPQGLPLKCPFMRASARGPLLANTGRHTDRRCIVLVSCDMCEDTLNVTAYHDDPPRAGWEKHNPRVAPGLSAWRCPECEARSKKREKPRAA